MNPDPEIIVIRKKKDPMTRHFASPASYPDLFTLLVASALILGFEVTAGILPESWPFLARLGLLRLIQCAALFGLLRARGFSLSAAGLDPRRHGAGLKAGLTGCALMALFAFAAGSALWLWGMDPLRMIRVTLPADPLNLTFFFVVGGLIAPVAEELFFRGFLFGYLKQFGWIPALCISTAAFALVHPGVHIPQWIGGFAFGLAYGLSGSLVAPMVIHACGNIVLFTLSMLARHSFF